MPAQTQLLLSQQKQQQPQNDFLTIRLATVEVRLSVPTILSLGDVDGVVEAPEFPDGRVPILKNSMVGPDTLRAVIDFGSC